MEQYLIFSVLNCAIFQLDLHKQNIPFYGGLKLLSKRDKVLTKSRSISGMEIKNNMI